MTAPGDGPVAHVLGEPMPDWSGPQPEGTHFQIDSTGVILLHLYKDPTPREIRGARTGRARFGLVSAGRHTLFLLYDIAQLTKGWADAPFALGLVPAGKQAVQPRSRTEGRLLLSLLADARSGVLLALRAISLTPAFCAALDAMLDGMRAALPSFTAAAHDAELRAAYQCWPGPADMAASASAIEYGGLPFHG